MAYSWSSRIKRLNYSIFVYQHITIDKLRLLIKEGSSGPKAQIPNKNKIMTTA